MLTGVYCIFRGKQMWNISKMCHIYAQNVEKKMQIIVTGKKKNDEQIQQLNARKQPQGMSILHDRRKLHTSPKVCNKCGTISN